MFEKLKKWAQHLKYNLYALYLASHHQDVSLLARALALAMVSYALSPIDLIPDFIPIIGYLDDLILLPLGVMLAIKLIPIDIWDECKMNARQSTLKSLPRSKITALVVVGIWIILTILLYLLMI